MYFVYILKHMLHSIQNLHPFSFKIYYLPIMYCCLLYTSPRTAGRVLFALVGTRQTFGFSVTQSVVCVGITIKINKNCCNKRRWKCCERKERKWTPKEKTGERRTRLPHRVWESERYTVTNPEWHNVCTLHYPRKQSPLPDFLYQFILLPLCFLILVAVA